MRSDLPAGSGLSSSAALEVACALAMGADGSDPIGLARMCQAAEHAARGVPTGLLDQLASICGVEGSGLHLDCRSLEIVPVPLPPSDVARWLVIWAGARSLADSGYADRVAELAAAEATSGRCATPRQATSPRSTIRRSAPAPATSCPRTAASTTSPRRSPAVTSPAPGR